MTKVYETVSSIRAPEAWSFLPKANTKQEKANRREQVRNFVVKTLNKGPQGLVSDFRQLKRVNDFSKMTEFVAQTASGKNRYKDVGCLDNNRVVLTIGSCSYIHANYAPLPSTCEDFWCMVVQEEAEVILMLCNFIEQASAT
ncbi:hypothetical protein COOONC_20789 [Cooperia oncophora]